MTSFGENTCRMNGGGPGGDPPPIISGSARAGETQASTVAASRTRRREVMRGTSRMATGGTTGRRCAARSDIRELVLGPDDPHPFPGSYLRRLERHVRLHVAALLRRRRQ